MLGTDTAGSVRVPAAFCGILGFRPSHGAVPVVGVLPMAQSFDTVGKYSVAYIIFSLHPGMIRVMSLHACTLLYSLDDVTSLYFCIPFILL